MDRVIPLSRSRRQIVFAFVVPCVVVLLFIVVFPLGYNLWMSLHNWNLVYPKQTRFIGLQNYLKIVTNGVFWYSLLNTFYYGFFALLIEFAFGMLIALVINLDFPGKAIVQTLVILPMVATPVAVSYVWRIMYNPDFGIINWVLKSLHLPAWNGIFAANTTMWSLIFIDVWQWTPFLTMIFSAALLSLPREALEAADVDGANAVQKFIHVTFPLMKTVVVIGVVLRGIDLFKTFDIIYSLTGGGPGRLTETLNIHTYNMLFTNLDAGRAAALSIIAVIIASITLLQLARTTALGGGRRK